MKLSENWLREWVNPAITTDELSEQLTMLGLEVDDVMPAAGKFTQVVVAEIVAVEKHADADKLNVCQVNYGSSENIQIVCGAPNVRVGLIAPLAIIGAVLPGNFKIKKSKLRGVESNGMLCSGVELGLSDDHSGLLELPKNAPIGVDVSEYMQLDDSIIDIDLTPNRADCFCLKGVAIDIACMNNMEIKHPVIKEIKESNQEKVEINLQAKQQCPRYLARTIKNINNNTQAPVWMQEKLRRSGIRSIHPVVDVTNYVMIELGQPMHAFDQHAINGDISIKMANKGEKVTLLDGKEIKLDDSYLMIADDKRHLAIAGVMGGLDSGVESETKDIILESAFFDPATIMGKSRDIGVHTESALRFERGVDPFLQEQAMHRATELIVEICGGEVGSISEALSEQNLPQAKAIILTMNKLQRVLGFQVDSKKVTEILEGLTMKVDFQGDKWSVIAPSSRFDMEIAEDLIEEVVRVVGYDNMPASNLFGDSVIEQQPEEMIQENFIKSQLNTLGYLEAINYSFVSNKQLENYGLFENSISLKNPLTEEFATMRTSLLPGLMETVKYNLRRQNNSMKLFETGNVFSQQEGIVEDNKIMAVSTGFRQLEHWSKKQDPVDFFDLKGDLETLLDNCKRPYKFNQSTIKYLHPGRQAEVVLGEKTIGWIGQVHPQICRRIGIKKDVYAFELYMKNLQETLLPTYEDISKYPSVRRDIAMIVDDVISAQQIKDLVSEELGKNVIECIIFDEYKGDNIGSSKRSLAVGIVLQQKNATFEDKEVDKLILKVVSSMTVKLNAEIRGN